MLSVIDFAHVIVNFSALCGRNVSCGIVALGNMLFEKWVHITDQVLTIKGTLHSLLVIFYLHYYSKIYNYSNQRQKLIINEIL